MKIIRISQLFLSFILVSASADFHAFAQATTLQAASEANSAVILKIFDEAWETIYKNFYDPAFNGIDWVKMKDIYRPQAQSARDMDALFEVIRKMMAELKVSHLDINMKDVIKKDELQDAARKLGRRLKKGEVPVSRKGFSCITIDGQGLLVYVEPGSPAKRAGVKPGWIWASVNEHPLVEGNPPKKEWLKKDQTNNYCFIGLKNEERIEGTGVMPDIEITESSWNPIRFGHDRWIEKAIEILNKPPQ